MGFRPSRWIRFALAILRFGRPIGVAWSADIAVRGEFAFGERVSIGARSVVQVPPGHRLGLGDHVYIGRDVELSPDPEMSLGDYTSIQDRCTILGHVTIGAYCLFAPNVFISSGTHHYSEHPSWLIKDQDLLLADPNFQPRAQRHLPVEIGEDCWIGANAIVMRGVRIGRGSIVGANSVVTANVAPYSIVAGAPARSIGQRLDFRPPQAIDATIDDHLPYFYSGFAQRRVSRSADGGGLRASSRFAIALDCRGCAQLELEVIAKTAVVLRHDTQVRSVSAGAQTVLFDIAGAQADGFLRLEVADANDRPASIFVLRAAARAS